MLDFLRKRKRNWAILFLLGLIIIVFVAFYGGNQIGDRTTSEVAMINGEPISQREFAAEYQRTIERYREMLKGQLTEEMIKGLNLKGNIVENLVQKKLVLQEAQSLGLLATDDDVARQLAQVPEFQVAGRFNKERYLQLLRANRLQPAQFEEDQRHQITLQRLYNIIIDSVQVSDAEVRERYRLDQEKINLRFVKLSVNDFASQVKLTEDDIKKFYERNKESLKEPLKVQVEYLTYPFEQFSADTPSQCQRDRRILPEQSEKQISPAPGSQGSLHRSRPRAHRRRRRKEGRNGESRSHRQRSASRQGLRPVGHKGICRCHRGQRRRRRLGRPRPDAPGGR